MTRLEARGLIVSYGSAAPALDGFDLDVASGERLVLLGASGAGKTTALRAIAGLRPPDTGDVLFDGQSVSAVPPERRGAAMVFQDHALFPFRTVGENVAFGLKVRRVARADRRARVAAALETVHLGGFEDRWSDELSGGERQRVALARALIVKPRVLLLDEPLANLDRPLRHEVRDSIRQVQRDTGVTTVMVTHDIAEALAMGDRIALIVDGRVRQVGPPQSFYGSPADENVARFFGAENFIAGVKRGDRVDTAIGLVRLADASAPDGPVVLTIHPDQVEVGVNGANSFQATVESSTFAGVIADCAARVGETTVRFSTPAARHPVAGDAVMLRLPAEHILVLPAG